MSPAPKSKVKISPKAAKEQQKASPPRLLNAGNARAIASTAPSRNGELLTVVELEEQIQLSVGNKSESDSVSSNGSCSGESEDQKEKAQMSTISQSEVIPGSDTDKRDKIRQKNERKHQRQKEKRAQELHERCNSILMSRKLDLLTQQFVAMGFPAERATRALLLNEGRVEDSVSWLFEGGTEEEQLHDTKKNGTANMKIDISNELARMTKMEAMFKCSKQAVQRAVVSCEGDLEKAKEMLSTQQKQDACSTPANANESSCTGPAFSGMNKLAQPSQGVVSSKPTTSVVPQHLRREERDPNYSKTAVGSGLPDSRNVALQHSLKPQSKSEWMKNLAPMQADKRWTATTSAPLFSYSLASSLQAVAPPPKGEARHLAVGSEGGRPGNQVGSIREPVVVMQRPQSTSVKSHQPSTSASLGMLQQVTNGWESSRSSQTDTVKIANGGLTQRTPDVSRSTGSLLNPNSQPFLQPDRNRHSFISSPSEVDAAGWGGSSWTIGRSSGLPSPLATPSSLGIFTGWGGSSGSSSPVDWSNGGLIPQFDYTRVDWSLDSKPLGSADLHSLASDQFYESSWSNQFEAPSIRNGGRLHHPCMGGAARIQDNSSLLSVDPIATVLSPDWTSPFAGKDIFMLPRQIVTSPAP